jgi:hypothetical protein
MRGFPLMIALIAGLWVVDTSVFNGRYRRAAWTQANYWGQMFVYEVKHALHKLNF